MQRSMTVWAIIGTTILGRGDQVTCVLGTDFVHLGGGLERQQASLLDLGIALGDVFADRLVFGQRFAESRT